MLICKTTAIHPKQLKKTLLKTKNLEKFKISTNFLGWRNMESATHTQTEKKDKTLRRRLREPLMIGERALALTKRLKKKRTLHKRTYISSL